jgi:hypothetical protein
MGRNAPRFVILLRATRRRNPFMQKEWDPIRVPFSRLIQLCVCYAFAVAFMPACSASAAALSVASQVNSGSVRPKCPYAAVFW